MAIALAAIVSVALGAYLAAKPAGSTSPTVAQQDAGSHHAKGSGKAGGSGQAKGSSPVGPRSCKPNAILVNPCRPWFGAVVGNNPGLPHNKILDFNHLEYLVGNSLDIFRDYHNAPGTGLNGALPLNHDELVMARRPHTYVDVNWKPARDWIDADGGNPTVNSQIAQAADNIKAIAPHKIFLTIWPEPQHNVTSDPGHPHCRTASRARAGTPAEYVAMWQNVERIFRQQGVTNVVWAMDFQNPPTAVHDCLIPQLWPGNKLVDWVLYDTYSRNAAGTWDKTIGPFYRVLERDSSPTVNFDSKPWGLGEFGTCANPDNALAAQFYLQGKAALKANRYPRLKMYIAFDSTYGNVAGPGCLSNYTDYGLLDPTKQHDFNQFAYAVLTHR